MIRMDQMTIKAQEVFQHAQTLAQDMSHQELKDAHVLAALLAVPDTAVMPILQKLGVGVAALGKDVQALVEKIQKYQGCPNSICPRNCPNWFKLLKKKQRRCRMTM